MNYLNELVQEPIFFQLRDSGEIWGKKKTQQFHFCIYLANKNQNIQNRNLWIYFTAPSGARSVFQFCNCNTEFASLSGKWFESEWLLDY